MTREQQIENEAYRVSNNSDEFNSFIQGAEWADKTMIDKSCEMLYAMLTTQDINDYDYVTAPAYDNVEDFIEDFRKAMEE